MAASFANVASFVVKRALPLVISPGGRLGVVAIAAGLILGLLVRDELIEALGWGIAPAAAWVSQVVNLAPGAVTALAICDGVVPADLIGTMHAVSTLILRGRQSKLQSHEDAVRLREALPHSMLIEPEDCGDFPAKDNPDSAAAALNLFITGLGESGESADAYSDSEPVDPKS